MGIRDFILLQQLSQQGRCLLEFSGITDVSDEPFQDHTNLLCYIICNPETLNGYNEWEFLTLYI